MDETQTLALQALRELLDNPECEDWDELVAANRESTKELASAWKPPGAALYSVARMRGRDGEAM